MIYETLVLLDDVKPGHVFRMKGLNSKYFVKTDREHEDTVMVMDATTGALTNLYRSLSVVEIKGK